MGKIIAIGGGEIGRPKEAGSFYPIETTLIDREIIAATGKKNPKLLFLPTASNDSMTYFELVKKHFMSLGCSSVDVLNLITTNLDKKSLEEAIFGADAIYVGGGNTLKMMNIWRKLGIDIILRRAFEKGIVLSGLSAGAICWFESGNSDSRSFTSNSQKLIRVKGLGYIPALCCPHFDTESHREADLKGMMKRVYKIPAIALDDGAAFQLIDDTWRIITSKPNAKAYKCYYKKGVYKKEEIPIEQELKDIKILLQK